MSITAKRENAPKYPECTFCCAPELPIYVVSSSDESRTQSVCICTKCMEILKST